MYLIQEFWLVAVASADRMAICPEEPISFASRSTSEVPICWVLAWLMNRWFGQVTSESNDTTLTPAAWALANEGQRALGSLPAMTMAAALAAMAAWIEGIWAAAVSAVPLLTTSLSLIAVRASLPPWSAMTSYEIGRASCRERV